MYVRGDHEQTRHMSLDHFARQTAVANSVIVGNGKMIVRGLVEIIRIIESMKRGRNSRAKKGQSSRATAWRRLVGLSSSP